MDIQSQSIAANLNVFKTMVDDTYEVKIRDGKYTLQCRPLPYATLLDAVVKVALSTREEIIEARRVVIAELSSVGVDNITPDNLTNLVTPLLGALVTVMPNIISGIVKDVVVGITDEQLKMLSVVDLLCVINGTLATTPIDQIVEQARPVFLWGSEVVRKAIAEMEVPEESKKEQPKKLKVVKP